MNKGLIYTVTDIENLHIWMKTHLEQFPLFEAVHENEYVKIISKILKLKI